MTISHKEFERYRLTLARIRIEGHTLRTAWPWQRQRKRNAYAVLCAECEALGSALHGRISKPRPRKPKEPDVLNIVGAVPTEGNL